MKLRSSGVALAAILATIAPGLPASVRDRHQTAAPTAGDGRVEREKFLSKAVIVTEPPADGRRSWRATLQSATRTHDASIETADGSDATKRNYRFNVAAYELDKLLDLNLVPPSVQRTAGGRPASLTWWIDDFSMNELDRRRKGIDPPDPERWREQVDAVRVFDELISNTYRDPTPGLYLNTVWDNLLIAKDWTVWIVDHTAAFRTRARLEDASTVTRCPRTMLDRLRKIDRDGLQRTLGLYLSTEQLDALEIRRALLVSHVDGQIAARGEAAVLFDFRPGG